MKITNTLQNEAGKYERTIWSICSHGIPLAVRDAPFTFSSLTHGFRLHVQ